MSRLIIEDKWRRNVIEMAFEFANMIWTPTEKNLYHGYDINGVLVNTPDADYASVKYNKCGWWRVGEQNQGMAYSWGGFCKVNEYLKAISEGRYAGNVPDLRESKGSRQCIGVDCSGLVSVCWGLQIKYGTSGLLSITSKHEKMESLLPGDVLLLPGSHVMIFIEFTDDTKSSLRIIDATRSTGKVSSRIVQVKKLLDEGYAGYYLDLKGES